LHFAFAVACITSNSTKAIAIAITITHSLLTVTVVKFAQIVGVSGSELFCIMCSNLICNFVKRQ
jgi:hypothetical protein